jgi:hypothetical protein
MSTVKEQILEIDNALAELEQCSLKPKNFHLLKSIATHSKNMLLQLEELKQKNG